MEANEFIPLANNVTMCYFSLKSVHALRPYLLSVGISNYKSSFVRRLGNYIKPPSSMDPSMTHVLENTSFCLELESGPLYFRTKSGKESTEVSEAFKSVFAGKTMLYLTNFVEAKKYARNIAEHEKLRTVLSKHFSKESELIPGLSFGNNGKFEKGFFVVVNCSGKENGDITQEKNFMTIVPGLGLSKVFKIYSMSDHVKIKQIQPTDKEVNTDRDEGFYLIAEKAPQIHPAFVLSSTNSVYHEIQKAYDVLNDSDHCAEIVELNEICNAYIKKAGDSFPLQAKNPVIVIEGLDATGKTTLTGNLGKFLNAKVMKSPPECICHLRSKFDSCSQLLRRAFYSLGNYAFAAMIHEAANDGVVIVDRFWNSTAAYAIAADVAVGGPPNLPPIGHWVYDWPSDLLKPHCIFLLTITDDERRKRLKKRGTIKTDEELRLERSSPFRLRLEEAYRRMDNPSMRIIDASGTEETVLDETLRILKAGGYI